jgi:hypothetical protein
MPDDATPPAKPAKRPSRFTAAAWAIFGGSFGCHWFYLRRAARAVPYILISLAGAFLFMKLCSRMSPDDVINFASTGVLPAAIQKSPLYVVSNILMWAPSVTGIVEGVVCLFTPKEEFDRRHNYGELK